jgi:hypothetical protein
MASAFENSYQQRKARAQSCPRPKHFPGNLNQSRNEYSFCNFHT